MGLDASRLNDGTPRETVLSVLTMNYMHEEQMLTDYDLILLLTAVKVTRFPISLNRELAHQQGGCDQLGCIRRAARRYIAGSHWLILYTD
jgi:hypothetical protein